MRRERIPCQILVDPEEPNVLIIRPKNKLDFRQNSRYDITIPALKMEDGTVAESQKIFYITEPDLYYVTLEEVLSMAQGLDLPEDRVMFHIREACRTANYWVNKANNKLPKNEHIKLTKENIKDEYYPMYMFIKTKATYDCIKEYYIEAVTKPYSVKDQVADLVREERISLTAIKALLDDLKKEYEEWLEKVVTITADPKWALRGKYSIPISTPNNKYFGLYHKTHLNGFNRGY
ncbi:MAG: hypothetical protein ACRDB0_03240 [Paraclostridium sp.]